MNLHLDVPEKYPDLKYFVDNYDTLCEAYNNQFIVIFKAKVVYASPSFDDAMNEAEFRKYSRYAIYRCTGNPDEDVWGQVAARCTLLPC